MKRYNVETSDSCLQIIEAIASGYNTPTEISRLLKKEQGTISDQMKVLLEDNYIIKGRRTKSQRYILNHEKVINLIKKKIQRLISIKILTQLDIAHLDMYECMLRMNAKKTLRNIKIKEKIK